MVKTLLAPLSSQVPIVDSQGRPLSGFIRQWSQQTAINGGIPALSTPAEVSAVIDVLGSAPGDILIRTSAGWAALPKGADGQQLVLAAGEPAWQATAAASAILDTISSTRGAVLYRGALGWAALAPGTASQVLTSGGAGADPAWAAGGGGGGSAKPNFMQPPIGLNMARTAAFAHGAATFFFILPSVNTLMTGLQAAITTLGAGMTVGAYLYKAVPASFVLAGGALVASSAQIGTLTPPITNIPFSSPFTLLAGVGYWMGLYFYATTTVSAVYNTTISTPKETMTGLTAATLPTTAPATSSDTNTFPCWGY